MRQIVLTTLVAAGLVGVLATPSRAQEETRVAGLSQPVEILIDHWGIPHIYADTEETWVKS